MSEPMKGTLVGNSTAMSRPRTASDGSAKVLQVQLFAKVVELEGIWQPEIIEVVMASPLLICRTSKVSKT